MNRISRIIEVASEDQTVLEKAHKDSNEMDMAVLKMLLSEAFDRDFYYVNRLDIETIKTDSSVEKEIVSGTGSCEIKDDSGKYHSQISYEINADDSADGAKYDAIEVVIESE